MAPCESLADMILDICFWKLKKGMIRILTSIEHPVSRMLIGKETKL